MQGRYTELVLIALCLALPVRVAAAQDGPLLCVPIEEVECEHTGDCQSNVYESMNIPQFIKVDLTCGLGLAALDLSGAATCFADHLCCVLGIVAWLMTLEYTQRAWFSIARTSSGFACIRVVRKRSI